MVDLTTQYVGLKLANPLVPSASPLSKDIDTAKRLEDAGASALVMYSLFEEKIEAEEQQIQRFFINNLLDMVKLTLSTPCRLIFRLIKISIWSNYINSSQPLRFQSLPV